MLDILNVLQEMLQKAENLREQDRMEFINRIHIKRQVSNTSLTAMLQNLMLVDLHIYIDFLILKYGFLQIFNWMLGAVFLGLESSYRVHRMHAFPKFMTVF